ncbi:MAG: 50S ribosomal protein L3 [Candidatus Nomurabacteria bacterium]|nr:MAG: 50S ribosomal protein L3 [Candidatus Nomurabacteria bacterium]HRV76165.1 50S ribosomal protein L3 [Candidatus Saccharimonadales bacterium]
MKAIIGTKLGMTQVVNEAGHLVPVTLVEAGPCTVTQIKNIEKDGYSAIQLGYGESKKLNKAQTGHLKQAASSSKKLKEFRVEEESISEELKVGSNVTIANFEEGDVVKVTAISKGKGFAGTIKRHNFSRGPVSHGSHNVRGPGSIGSMYPQKVFKGKKMAGHMGNEQVTTRGLKVAYLDAAANIIGIKGAIPGPNKGIVYIVGGAK